ncbi:pyocin knob domain-containing protein [Fictibacillus sp. JL2B1089]|uniref:pyocin knob domain-containing protein n=1 Tax=Fictibacillus sp. JL2B1089 TaxID=3399565 RepID=UPI003A8B2610
MPFSKPLPEWNNLGTKPPQSKIDTGWLPDDRPPADWWNWFHYTTHQALLEVQQSAIHTDRAGQTIAQLVSGKVPVAQLPDGTTAAKGIVQLSSATNSNSASLAATPLAVKTAYDLANGKYSKPSNGIPKVDLDTGVQNSLNKADSALQNVPSASTIAAGIVQLNDATNSTSTSQAATPNAVKKAYDKAEEKETPLGAQTKANAAETNAINFAKNFGLGDVAKDISNTDLNNLDLSGDYKGHTLANCPIATGGSYFYFIKNHKHDNGHRSQTAIRYGAAATTGQIFQRLQINGLWQPWKQLATTDAVQIYRLTNDDGVTLGFGGDLNTLTSPGFYYINSNATNRPFNTGGQTGLTGLCEVHRLTSANGYFQTVTSSSRKAQRYYNSGAWGPWLEIPLLSANGILTLPNQPYFFASTSVDQSISSGVDTKITLGSKLGDTHGEFINGIFTPKESGVYLLSVLVQWTTVNNGITTFKLFNGGSSSLNMPLGSNGKIAAFSRPIGLTGGTPFELYLHQDSGSAVMLDTMTVYLTKIS